MKRRLIHTVIWTAIGFALVTAADYEFCTHTNVELGGVGQEGIIKSQNWPASMKPLEWNQPNCFMDITACPGCRIKLTIEKLQLPPCILSENVASCHHGCDHLLLLEPDYTQDTTRNFLRNSVNRVYWSMSSRVYLKFCDNPKTSGEEKGFLILYEVLDKTYFYPGNKTVKEGVIKAPNFPRGYSQNNEVTTYIISGARYEKILLEFTDWNISPSSTLEINSMGKDGPISKTYQSTDPRPALIETYDHTVTLVFTAKQSGFFSHVRYLGFKAKYTLVPKTNGSLQERVGCGTYYRSLLGGFLRPSSSSCTDHSSMLDCVWVITKQNDATFDYVSLSIHDMFFFGDELLEIRKGNSSDGELVEQVLSNEARDSLQFWTTDAFYIRLVVPCSRAMNTFYATFASFTNSSMGSCRGRLYKCQGNHMCIASQLHCDKVEHCWDGSDEIGCDATASTTTVASKCEDGYFECDMGRHYYCPWEKCDAEVQCIDRSDESGCPQDTPSNNDNPSSQNQVTWSVYIPIGLACVTAAIVVCMIISFCTRRKHMLRRRQQRNAERMATPYQASIPPPVSGVYNVESDYFIRRDAPPTYDEAINDAQPYMYNMGFQASPTRSPMPQPPPYTPGDPSHIPPPQPGQRCVQTLPVVPSSQMAPVHLGPHNPGAGPAGLRSVSRQNCSGQQPPGAGNRNSPPHTLGVDNLSFEPDRPVPRSIVGMADIGIRFSDLQDDMGGRTSQYRPATGANTNSQRNGGMPVNENSQQAVMKEENTGRPKDGPQVSTEVKPDGAAKDDKIHQNAGDGQATQPTGVPHPYGSDQAPDTSSSYV